ncbi:MAG: hypothetical protein WCK65_02105, partial [Rhodospirillaceae bacterium]
HIRAKPQEYVDCIRRKQALPDYAPLVGKLLFTKAPTSKTAIKNTNANAAEQLNILRWELERKDCVLVMDAYLEYFSNTDTTVAKRFTKLQGQIRDAHTDLSHERITYTIAIQRILDADRVFWRSASSKHRDMAIILNQSWIDEIPTQ